jgi:hypothetical protein
MFNNYVALPVKHFIALLCSVCPYSVGEIMIFLAIAGALFYIARAVRDIVRADNKRQLIYRRTLCALCALLTLAFMLELSLGASNFSSSFQEKSGIWGQESSVETLYTVTVHFAHMASQTGVAVPRGEDGVFNEKLGDLIAGSTGIYDAVEAQFPFLKMRDVKPKRLILSRLMSASGYTGFYFPLTGEANINTDCPLCLIPATVAHEFAHQRGVAYENEANFVAILACTLSDNDVYKYSGWLLGYIYLSNALFKQDSQLWGEARSLLTENVLADLKDNSDYWAQFEDNTVSKVSDAVYSAYLKSSGQELGLQSYGAVVDMLIAYYAKN